MADDERTTPHAMSLVAALQRAPHQFDFFQALRRLECSFRDRPRWGEAKRPEDEPFRLGQAPSLAFAPSTLASFVPAGERGPARLNVNFFGVFGPNGPLPLHLTEYAQQRLEQHGDATFARFLDLFHHRLLSLFYRAWANSRPTVQRDRPKTERFGMYVGSLLGIGLPSFRDRDALPDRAKLYYAARFAGQVRNAEGLRDVIGDFFEMPAAIEPFVGEWIDIPRAYAWSLGSEPRRGAPRMGLLGPSALLGTRVYTKQHKFRVVLGPLSLAQFRRMAPGGASVPRLVSMVRNYIGDELAWDVRLMPKREAVQPLKLGTSQLGWTTWLVRDSQRPMEWEDLIFDPQQKSAGAGRLGFDAAIDTGAVSTGTNHEGSQAHV